ncbi:A disintegrin and metalloproteinase with thrombospondin motifs 16 [Lates japonicus]|uniref:A disintegrin and metalloproteinase with thrombospondin motifs 16 n=1 Tax=Lates japonicus TaxID=270547 RepID=A0AAD3N6A9_LATJO|nr:A disintegrin and metalloproteinase with thrombospondin motifs 16 [Lates japonicus]
MFVFADLRPWPVNRLPPECQETIKPPHFSQDVLNSSMPDQRHCAHVHERPPLKASIEYSEQDTGCTDLIRAHAAAMVREYEQYHRLPPPARHRLDYEPAGCVFRTPQWFKLRSPVSSKMVYMGNINIVIVGLVLLDEEMAWVIKSTMQTTLNSFCHWCPLWEAERSHHDHAHPHRTLATSALEE